MTARGFAFTSFEVDRDFSKELKADYLIIGREECPETKKAHLQCFAYYSDKKSVNKFRKEVAPSHVETIRGTIEDNIKYCSKGGNFTEYGERPHQGRRTDLEKIVKDCKAGKKMREIVEDQPEAAVRYLGNIQKIHGMFAKKRDWVMDVRIYHGSPGSGKTKAVYDEFGANNIYAKSPSHKWWDGYAGEDCVLIDDFEPFEQGYFNFRELLRLFDRYPMSIEFKGGVTEFRSKTVIITTNIDPDSWYPLHPDRAALTRRISQVKKFGEISQK